MPRRSPYEIVLTQAEREALEAVVRKYTSSYCDVMRAKSALLAADGLDNKQIGARLDLPRQIVLFPPDVVMEVKALGPTGFRHQHRRENRHPGAKTSGAAGGRVRRTTGTSRARPGNPIVRLGAFSGSPTTDRRTAAGPLSAVFASGSPMPFS